MERLAEWDSAFTIMDKFMRSLVVSQRDQLAAHGDLDSKRDLFSRLLRANEGEEKKLALDDDELVKFLRAFRTIFVPTLGYAFF